MKKENMIDEKLLDKTEAGYFIEFLEQELHRHKLAIREADYHMRFFALVPVLKVAYQSSIVRHLEDTKMINYTIEYLRNKFSGG